MNRFQKLLIQN